MILIMPLISSGIATAASTSLHSPTRGVVCDEYFCANAKEGISIVLTKKYISKKASDQLTSMGNFDHTAFTFSNGVYCDINEKTCYSDRFFGADGKLSAPVDTAVSQMLFPN